MAIDLRFLQNKRITASSLGLGLLFLIGFFYFSFIAINGNHGIKKKVELQFHAIELRAKLEKLKTQAGEIEQKADKLRGPKIDLDLLDEQARKGLGLIRIDEVILLK